MNKILNFVNLHKGEEDRKKVLDNVTANISFRDSNLWILTCAVVVASVGLNVNSTAVIIGAMLISPLMGANCRCRIRFGHFRFCIIKKVAQKFAYRHSSQSYSVDNIFFCEPV